MFNQLCSEIRQGYGAGAPGESLKEMLAELWDIYLLPSVRRLAQQSSGGQAQNLEARVSNVLHVLDRFQEEVERDMPLDEIIQDFTMMVENNPEMDMNLDAKVRLMTIHASKGLEFDCVYLASIDNMNMPGETNDQAEIEEARRVAYVGMTRAREKLVVSHARRKFHRGKYMETRESPFINDVRRHLGIKTTIVNDNTAGQQQESPSPA